MRAQEIINRAVSTRLPTACMILHRAVASSACTPFCVGSSQLMVSQVLPFRHTVPEPASAAVYVCVLFRLRFWQQPELPWAPQHPPARAVQHLTAAAAEAAVNQATPLQWRTRRRLNRRQQQQALYNPQSTAGARQEVPQAALPAAAPPAAAAPAAAVMLAAMSLSPGGGARCQRIRT